MGGVSQGSMLDLAVPMRRCRIALWKGPWTEREGLFMAELTVVEEICRATGRKFSAEEKSRIALEGLRGEKGRCAG